MTGADKSRQAVELLERVRNRLLKSPTPQHAMKAHEFVVMFLVCMEELQKIAEREK